MPTNLTAAAERVRVASLPTREQGTILPFHHESRFAPGWDVFTAQQRTVKVDALRWPRSRDTYEDMCRDPQIQGLLMSLFLPIRHMQWYVDPAGTTGTVAEEIAEDFGLPLDGDAQFDEDGAGVDFDEHLRLALLALAHGHKAFEQTGVIEGTGLSAKYRLRRLHERPSDTLESIFVSAGGDLVAIRVNSAEPDVDGPFVDVGDEHLLYYCWDRRGADWTGRPLLYGLYRAWLLKDELVREDATMVRRFGGIPVAETTDASVQQPQIDEAAAMAQLVQSGDGAGVGLPFGTRLRILGVEGTLPKPLESVKYHDGQMSRAFMQMVMELGNTEHGSRALGETLMDHYGLGVLSIAKWVRKTQMQLVRRIVEWNYGPGTPLPHIRCRLDDQADLPAGDLVSLIDAGAIVVDDDLEDQIRKRGNLVPRNRAQAGRVAPAKATPTASAAETKHDAKRHRHGRSLAAAIAPPPDSPIADASVDFAALQDAFKAAHDLLTATWNGVRSAQIADLVLQVRAAASAEQVASITPAVLGAQALVNLLTGVLEHGAQTAVDEAVAQGAELAYPDLTAATALLERSANATAIVLSQSLGTSAASKALSMWGPDADPDVIADAVQAHLEGLAGATADYELAGLASQAQNEGRFVAMEGAGEDSRHYASELNDDPNCCLPCREVNDAEYTSMAEARRDYPTGHYVGCEGIKRCRGTIVTIHGEA